MLTGLAQTVAGADPEIWWLIGFCGLFSGMGFVQFKKGLHRYRLIENTPRSLLRSAAQGYVELHGTARLLPGEPIVARLSGERCVWFSFAVAERRRASNGKTKWVTVERGTSTDLFELHDDTGDCVVDPEGADIIAVHKDQWYGESRWPDSGPPARRGWFRSGRYRYTEQRLHEGEEHYVLGNFSTESLHIGTDAAVNDLLRKWKLDQATLVHRFDTNRDGNIDAAEWDSARTTAGNEVRARQVSEPARPPMNVMQRPAESDRPYIISAQSQAQLIKRYRANVWMGIALFLTFGAAFAWMVGVRLST
jgi:hypothetical protein